MSELRHEDSLHEPEVLAPRRDKVTSAKLSEEEYVEWVRKCRYMRRKPGQQLRAWIRAWDPEST